MSHPCREHDIAFLSQTYADLEVVNRQLENEKEQHKVDFFHHKMTMISVLLDYDEWLG